MRKKFRNYYFLFLLNLLLVINAFASNSSPKTDVIIIGAGMSGLAAAQKLKQQNYQVLVLEAKNRIGGRILTQSGWGTATELGGSWLHSSKVNPLVPIIKKENIPLISTQYTLTAPLKKFSSMTIYKGDGQALSEKDKQKTLEFVKEFSLYLEEHQKEFADETSYTDVINQFSMQNKLSSLDRYYLTCFIKAIISFDNGADLNQFSAKMTELLNPAENLGPDMLFERGGYGQLFRDMIKDVPILLNHKVTKITYDKAGVKVTAAGHVYQSRYVIITLPLGVLKAHSVQFSPELPREKIQAIKNLGYGTYNKVYLLFSRPFWKTNSEWLELLPDVKHPEEFYEVLNYYKFSHQPILLVFVAGNYAKLMENFTDKQIANHIMQRLRLVYGSSTSKPTSFIITRWGHDPYSYGSYSYQRIGSTEQNILNLAKPVANKLFFAGEATSTDDYGTVHGAYNSGIRAAGEIIKVCSITGKVANNSQRDQVIKTAKLVDGVKSVKAYSKIENKQ